MMSLLNSFGNFVLPFMVVSIVAYGLYKKVKVFDCFIEGAKKGLFTVYELLPTITGLVLAVTMLQKSGGMELIAKAFSPISNLLGIPQEVTPMALLSPVSGGGSLSLFENILKQYGASSIDVCCVHPILTNNGATRIYAAGANKIIGTNTLSSDTSRVSIAKAIADALRD